MIKGGLIREFLSWYALCTLTIEAMRAVFEVMGLKFVQWNRISCVSKGDGECVTILDWRT